jgi:hypothetical protein
LSNSVQDRDEKKKKKNAYTSQKKESKCGNPVLSQLTQMLAQTAAMTTAASRFLVSKLSDDQLPIQKELSQTAVWQSEVSLPYHTPELKSVGGFFCHAELQASEKRNKERRVNVSEGRARQVTKIPRSILFYISKKVVQQ